MKKLHFQFHRTEYSINKAVGLHSVTELDNFNQILRLGGDIIKTILYYFIYCYYAFNL